MPRRRLRPAHTFSLCLLLAACAVPARAESQRRILSDFEDAGTWRLSASTGLAPGAWFAASVALGSAEEAAHDGSYGGKISYVFQEDRGPWRLAFIRQKSRELKGRIDGIEFDADAHGSSGTLRFTLLDSSGKSHSATPVRLLGPGWQRHRVAIDATTVKTFASLRFPAVLEQIVFESDAGGSGAVYLDDLALTGEFPPREQVTIQPVYDGIAQSPAEAVRVRYLLRNATAAPVETELRWSVRASGSDAEIFSDRRAVSIPARGSATVVFDACRLPVAAYEAVAMLGHQGATISYEDHFGVFEPNGRRLNRSPMWFGVQDLTYWQAAAENRLHLSWMQALGVDLNRMSMTGSRFRGDLPLSQQGWREIIAPFDEAGIDNVLSLMEGPPWFNQARNARAAVEDLPRFEAYCEDLGRFFSGFKSVRYVEFWNEPDIDFYTGTFDAYKEMFTVFGRALRRTAPGVKIGTGGVTVLHPREKKDFSRRLYQETGDVYDLALFHAHGPAANYAERQRMIEGWLAGAGLDKRIANTESGERSGYTAAGRHLQAIELVKKMTYSKGIPSSEFHLWFTLQDYGDFDPGADDSFGLVTSDNRAKPAFVAYNALIRRLANTVPESVRQPADVNVTAFRREDGRHVYVVWPAPGNTGAVLRLRAPAPVEIFDLFGRAEAALPASAATILPVGQNPLYLESATPLAFLAAEEVPLRAPAEVYRDPGEATGFAASLRNDSDTPLQGRLVLNDAGGRAVWEQPLGLAPRATLDFTPQIPASASPLAISPVPSRYVLAFEPVEGGGASISLPVSALPAYPITPVARAEFRNRLDQLPVIALDQAQDVFELAFDPTIGAWHGPDDLSAHAWFAREKDDLLIRIEVKDDNHVQSRTGNQLWKGDSVQLAFFNPANKAHTLVDLGLTVAGPVVWAHQAGDGSAPGAWAVPADFRRGAGTTIYETSLPLAKLGFAAGPRPVPLRFALLVNEDDGQGRVRWIHWLGGLGKNKNVSELGHGLLK